MMGKLTKWSNKINKLEETYGVDVHKMHLLGIAEKAWGKKTPLRVTDLLDTYQNAARATTHKAIKELVEGELLHMVGSEDDGRVRFLQPGRKLSQLEKML
jgi:hypothetical protein